MPTQIFGVHFRAPDVNLDANRIPSKYSSSAIINHMEVSSVPAKTKDDHKNASFPTLPKWVNFVSSLTDGSVFPCIGGSFLVSVKAENSKVILIFH